MTNVASAFLDYYVNRAMDPKQREDMNFIENKDEKRYDQISWSKEDSKLYVVRRSLLKRLSAMNENV